LHLSWHHLSRHQNNSQEHWLPSLLLLAAYAPALLVVMLVLLFK
jgi:hypothetical protein